MKSLLKRKLVFGILIITVIFLISIFIDLTGLSEIPELKTVDFRIKAFRKNKVLPSDIVVVLIDDASLNALNKITGRWPWPRNIHAEFMEFLALSGAKAIVLDILFTENEIEPDQESGQLSRNDLRLVESTDYTKNTYHAVQILSDVQDEYNPDLLDKPMPVNFINKFSLDVEAVNKTMEHNNYYLPFKELYEVSKGIGVVSFLPDHDGVFRSEKLLFNYQDNYFPSLALAPLVGQLGNEKIVLKKGSMEIKTTGSLIRIPLMKNNEYLVNMYGLYNAFSISGVILSMSKIQQGELDDLPVDPEEFKDKIVFVGASAGGIEDLKHTSIATKTPGVFIHASICGNILTGDFLNFTGPVINFLSILILLVITVFSIFYLKTVLFQTVVPFFAMIIFFIIAFVLFNSNIVINMASPSFAFLAAYIVSFTYISFTEGKEKRKIRNVLGQYVSPAILSTVLDKNQDDYLKAEVGTRENLTIFFSDIRGFTEISEKYNVETVVEILNGYLSRMVNIIFNNEGTLDKFIGDAIVAFWGAPVRLPDHHYKAVISGIQMMEALKTFNQENIGKDLPELKIGIGIHTGDVILGNIGSEKKLDFTVIGDSVNLASRLEGITKTYKSPIIISQDTYDHVHNEISCKVLDYVKVKGKNKPIKIYEVIDTADSVDEETAKIADLTEKGFEQYQERKFSEAINTYESILDIRPEDFLSKMFIERCREYQQNEPPENWDGFYVHKTK